MRDLISKRFFIEFVCFDFLAAVLMVNLANDRSHCIVKISFFGLWFLSRCSIFIRFSVFLSFGRNSNFLFVLSHSANNLQSFQFL